MKKRILFMAMLSITSMNTHAAQIFESIDANGVTTYSDTLEPANEQVRQFNLADNSPASSDQHAAPNQASSPALEQTATELSQNSVSPPHPNSVNPLTQKILNYLTNPPAATTEEASSADPHSKLITAYHQLDAAKQNLNDKITAEQEAQDTLDSLSPSATTEIQEQQHIIQTNNNALETARQQVTMAENNVENAERSFQSTSAPATVTNE